jgi:uncharacterized membrane protein YesL
LRVTWQTLVGLNDELVPLVKGNLIWFLCTLPLAFLLFLVLALLAGPSESENPTVLPAFLTALLVLLLPNPAAGGLYGLAAVIEEGESPQFSSYWEALRAYWRRGLALFAIGLGGVLLSLFNLTFYLNSGGWLALLSILWLYGLVFWLCLQQYLFPLLVYSSDKRLWRLYQKATYLTLGHPLFSLVLLVVAVLFVLLSTLALPLFPLGSMAFMALLGTRALGALREHYGEKRREPSE